MTNTAAKGFCMFFDWMDTLAYLPPKDYKEMCQAIAAYYTEGRSMVESVSKAALKALAHNIQMQINRMEENSEERRKAAEASHESRRSKKMVQNLRSDAMQLQSNAMQEQCNAMQLQSIATDTDTDTDTDTEYISLSRPTAPEELPEDFSENVSENFSEDFSEERAAEAAAASSVSDGTPLKKSPSSKKLEEEFDRLWELYPRKEGKKKALAAYERARRRGVTYEEVEAGVKAYAQVSGQREMRYIKNGSTWFGGECWNDEVKEDGYKRHEWDEEFERITAQYAGRCGNEF